MRVPVSFHRYVHEEAEKIDTSATQFLKNKILVEKVVPVV
jgi:hypothetical protein